MFLNAVELPLFELEKNQPTNKQKEHILTYLILAADGKHFPEIQLVTLELKDFLLAWKKNTIQLQFTNQRFEF